MTKILFLIFLSVSCAVMPINWAMAQTTSSRGSKKDGKQVANPSVALQTARAEFAKTNYDKAIQAYRTYLRSIPTDYIAWGQLGASYYHAGQPRKAQQTLQRIERLSPEQSFVYYYQGLCFSVLGMESTAQKYWEYAGWFTDESGAKATIELAISTYNAKEDGKARFLANSYLQRFPQGPHRQVAIDILASLDAGKRLENLTAGERPDPELAIYKYSRLSLFHIPHFWYVQTGFMSDETIGYQPTSVPGELSEKTEGTYAFLANASLGLGPVRQKYATAYAGYSYKQRWNMDRTSLDGWMSDLGNLEAFPLRGDLLERTHQLYGDVRRQIYDKLYMGTYGRLDYSRVGSSFFPSPDDNDLRVVLNLTDTQLLIPWIGWSWNESSRTMLYFYFRKEIHNNSPDHSNKTYDLTGDTGEEALSLGLSHSSEIPTLKLGVSAELFMYEYVFNDYWLDYSRKGALLGADYNIWRGLNAFLNYGMYQDSYKLPRIKQGDCSASGGGTSTGDAATDPAVNTCNRNDSGSLMQLGVYWNQNPNLRITGSYSMVENASGMKEYSESRSVIKVDVTWAFPGVKRVYRLIERFADASFTRDSEQ